MKYLLIFVFLFNFALFSKEKKSIYVYKILMRNTKDLNFESKFRNKMTEILLKDFSDYNLMDDDSIIQKYLGSEMQYNLEYSYQF